jgi:glycosyltransferase involved in cell wall biosynthesis
MKRLDRRLILSGLARVTGVISLTAPLAEDFAAGKPALLMEGIARPLAAPGTRPPVTSPGPRVALYAGGLHEDYGVRALIDAVGLSRRDWVLHLYGRGPMEEECRSIASSDPRVVFHGVADATTLAEAYAQATVLVNPRQLRTDFVRYSFPSKLIEYLATGTPVVTTHLPTIPPDYDPFLIYTDDDAASIARTLDSTTAKDASGLRALGARAAEFVRSTRSPRLQGERIQAFVAGLSARGPDLHP